MKNKGSTFIYELFFLKTDARVLIKTGCNSVGLEVKHTADLLITSTWVFTQNEFCSRVCGVGKY